MQGHRLIAEAMAKWCAHSDVLAAAWARLSPSFRIAASRKATQAFERKAMAKHDLVERCDPGARKKLSNGAKRGGCVCNLCGQTFLWRQQVTEWERATGQVEDAITYDRLGFHKVGLHCDSAGLNTGRCLSDGRTGEDLLKCTLCYQAHCGHCSGRLEFRDYLWSNDCLHCGMVLLPQFTRRPIIFEPTSIWPPLGEKFQKSEERQKYGRPEGEANTHTMTFQCSCCGVRCSSADSLESSFCYLSWQDYDYPRRGHYGSLDKSMKVSRPVRKPGYLCGSCKQGRGVWYKKRNEYEWADSSVAFYRHRYEPREPVFWKCKCRERPLETY